MAIPVVGRRESRPPLFQDVFVGAGKWFLEGGVNVAGTAHSIFPQIRGLLRTPLVVHWALFMISPTYFAPIWNQIPDGAFRALCPVCV
jgi:hypothetical protein